ncbi:MAG: hypothetical protein HQL08_11010, partial [Nitrospirae bacterium]|nr:hypothetical protein [Nitrospirota bacterium]
MRQRAVALLLSAAILMSVLLSSNAIAAEIEVAPGIKAMDPSNTGAAVLRVPIEVPPGRGGIAPNMTLSYNSGSGYGWVGMGWNLEPGAIQRSTRNGVDYTASDFIFLKDDASQELVSRVDWGANYYGDKIEGAFTRYLYNTGTGGWEVTTKDGLKYYYGSTKASRQNNPWNYTNNNQVFKWYLDKVQDLNGNYMTFTYSSDTSGSAQGITYLSRIDYTYNSGGLSSNYVQFQRNGTA